MKRKELLMKRLLRIRSKKEELAKRALASSDVNEVRELNARMEEMNEDISDIEEEVKMLEEEEKVEAARSATITSGMNGEIDAGIEIRNLPSHTHSLSENGINVASFGYGANPGSQERQNVDVFATLEYRQAFKNYVQRGEKIPEELVKRNGEPANTNSLGASIPTTILNEFINEIRKVYGNLYYKVRKMNVPGAVKIPISQLQATFKWITEDTVSPRQKGGNIDQFVEFSYNTAEIRVAQTLLSSIVALDIFEREVVRIMLVAYLQAMDISIVKGTGQGQPLGILNDPRILATGNVIEMNASEINDWTQWRKKFFAKLPLGYRGGEFIFSLETVDAYLETMADANNNPVFRQATGLEVNDGDSRNPNGRFFGRDISLVEPDVLPGFDDAANGDVIGIFWQPDEYAINTNLEFGMRRYFDEEKNEWVNKMLTIVDGKVLNPMGFWLIKKKGN